MNFVVILKGTEYSKSDNFKEISALAQILSFLLYKNHACYDTWANMLVYKKNKENIQTNVSLPIQSLQHICERSICIGHF